MRIAFSAELNENRFSAELNEDGFFERERLFQMSSMRTAFSAELNENDFFD
jgi:hypothetical protein